MIGVVPLYRALRKQLEDDREKIAPLQLLGRIEDYLTKEFASVILLQPGTPTLPLMNTGKKVDERRVDLALVNGNLLDAADARNLKVWAAAKKKLRVWGFIEVKYLRNRHRFAYANAEDEHGEVFKSLHRQLRRFDPEKFAGAYAGYPVHLRSGKGDTYGLIFASHVCRTNEKLSPEQTPKYFVRRIITSGKTHGFKSWNFTTPRLNAVYSDVPISLLRAEYRISLYSGLWRLDPNADCSCGCPTD